MQILNIVESHIKNCEKSDSIWFDVFESDSTLFFSGHGLVVSCRKPEYFGQLSQNVNRIPIETVKNRLKAMQQNLKECSHFNKVKQGNFKESFDSLFGKMFLIENDRIKPNGKIFECDSSRFNWVVSSAMAKIFHDILLFSGDTPYKICGDSQTRILYYSLPQYGLFCSLTLHRQVKVLK